MSKGVQGTPTLHQTKPVRLRKMEIMGKKVKNIKENSETTGNMASWETGAWTARMCPVCVCWLG